MEQSDLVVGLVLGVPAFFALWMLYEGIAPKASVSYGEKSTASFVIWAAIQATIIVGVLFWYISSSEKPAVTLGAALVFSVAVAVFLTFTAAKISDILRRWR